MRPVERGPWPQEANGTNKNFNPYGKSRADLMMRMEQYCVFCDRRLETSLAVEHKLPKASFPALEHDWNNFLLACTNCNSTKGQRPNSLSDIYWPDQDNTFRAFEYVSGGRINVASGLTQIQTQKAQETLDLMGLQRTPNFSGGASDRRWMNRREAWDLAEQQKQTLTQIDTPTIRQMIVDMAKFRGYWSVWMTVFASNANMRSRLINGFTGSASNCFDASMNPVKRPGGAL